MMVAALPKGWSNKTAQQLQGRAPEARVWAFERQRPDNGCVDVWRSEKCSVEDAVDYMYSHVTTRY